MSTVDLFGSGSALPRLKTARFVAVCLVAALGSACGNSGDEGTSGASPALGSDTAASPGSTANSGTGATPSGPAPAPSNNPPAAVPGGPTATTPASNPPLPSSTATVPSGEIPAPSSSETSSAAGGEGGTTPTLPTGEGGAGTSGSTSTSHGEAGTAGLGGSAGASNSVGEGGTSDTAGTNSGGAGAAAASGETESDGCGQTPTLMNSSGTGNFSYNTLTSGGTSRRYILRWPEDYDNERPYRLILGFHGATGNGGQVAGNPAYFGLYELAEGSTIFIAPDAVDGLWNAEADATFVDDILTQVTNDLCIDTSRIMLEGFSQGGAMVRTLACERPGVFRAAVAHSAGGLALPSNCMPIPYLGSLGLQESTGASGQTTQTDFFAEVNGCTISTLPTAPDGGHICADYDGCSAGNPTRWCSFDGPHTPAPTEGGMSWMPQEVWTFFSQF